MNLVGRGRAGTQRPYGRGFSHGGGGLNSGCAVTENENILSNDNDQLNIGTGLIALLLGQGRGRGSLHGRGGRGRGGLHNSAADAPVTDETELGPQGNLDNPLDGPTVFGLAAASGGRGRGGRGMMRGGCGVQFGRGGLHTGADAPVNAPEERGPRDDIIIDHGVDEPPTFLASASSGRGRGMRGPPGPFGTFGRGGAQLVGNAGAGNQQQQHTAQQQQHDEAGQQQQQHGAGQQQQHAAGTAHQQQQYAAGSGTGNQQQQHEAGQQQQQYAAGQQQQHTAGTGNQQQQYAAGAGQQHTTGTGTGNQQRQYDENNNRESRSNNSQQEPEYDRWHNSVRRSYMPPEKTTLELFDEDIHIQRGPRFEEQFGHQHDNEIIVTCDGREIQQSHRSIETFHGFNLSQEILNSIQIRNYETPTPIQKAVIPLIMSHGDDIMANAQTGSGKTAAFLLPIVHNLQIIVRQETRDDNLRRIRSSNYAPKPKCIVMVPAKELAEQIYEEARIFAENTGVSVARSYGDMQMHRSMLSIKLGCDILVLTSGRLMHHIKANHINLSSLRYFVLDEADKLIEERHFCDAVDLTIVKSALHTNNPTRDPHAVHCRVMLFSATFNEGVQQLAQQILLGGYFFVRIGEMNRAVEIIEQTFIEVRPRQKQEQLLAILSEGAVEETSPDGQITYRVPAMKTIVFVEGRRFAVLLTATLAARGFRVAKLTSDCPLERRLKVREHFLRGNVKLVVATNLMSRGLNFPEVGHVINYDLPNYEPHSFIHRVGRTGRAGNLGQATSFFDPGSEADRNNAAFYVKVLNAAKQQVPDFLRLCAAQAFDFSEYDLPGDFQGPSAAGLPSGWDNRSDDNWAQRDRNNMMDAANAPTTSSHNPPSSSTVDNSGNNGLSSPISSDDANGQRGGINSRDTTDVIESSDDTIGLSDGDIIVPANRDFIVPSDDEIGLSDIVVPSDDDIGLSDGDFIGPADDDTIELSLSDRDTIVADDDDAIGLSDDDIEENIVAPDAEHCAARFNEIRDQLLGTPLQRQ